MICKPPNDGLPKCTKGAFNCTVQGIDVGVVFSRYHITEHLVVVHHGARNQSASDEEGETVHQHNVLRRVCDISVDPLSQAKKNNPNRGIDAKTALCAMAGGP